MRVFDLLVLGIALPKQECDWIIAGPQSGSYPLTADSRSSVLSKSASPLVIVTLRDAEDCEVLS
jgi:hypothetical protein